MLFRTRECFRNAHVTRKCSFFFFFGEGKGRGRREGGKRKEILLSKYPSMYFFFFLPKLLLLSLPCYPYLFFTGIRDYFDKIIGRGFDFFFFFFTYVKNTRFFISRPKFGKSAYQIFFPFLNLEQSKEVDIKSFPELISRNLIL